MLGDRTTAFNDNWGYLKTEFNWLDRVLRLAVAKRQRERKAIDRVSKTPGDRASSDWWKGLVILDGTVGRDEIEKLEVFAQKSESLNYQQQLEEKIQASQEQGILLGLPMLCDRAALSLFEKHLVLASLAPEVNHRYSRLYQYLQEDQHSGLPTVDLILRLFCRGDNQWREARSLLTSTSILTQLGLVQFLPLDSEIFLNHRVKLTPKLINYLLADRPDESSLEDLLHSTREALKIKSYTPKKSWSELIVALDLQETLKYMAYRYRDRQGTEIEGIHPGQIMVFSGISGTGKTTATEAIATEVNQNITEVDLQLLPDPITGLSDLKVLKAPILLIKSAHLWLKRCNQTPVYRFLRDRQQHQSLTILTLDPAYQGSVVLQKWLREGIVEQILVFPLPEVGDRLKLWKQAFPAPIRVSPSLDWEDVAQRWKLTGGQILAIAHKARIFATLESPETSITQEHLQRAVSMLPLVQNKKYRYP
ncbi:MAG: hypothetical protein J7545_20790 [Roseofilum sp. SBFL]|uniref:hypothetical protein n=1 Tax=unclassified Roseofilum TaxID=2620099 RepID=UPI001B257588|nr:MULTISPECIES: hypothetical protein [unclassified Roseofilum]MBP0012813.1 hypothetical protein [Roseofilum sp. SID3]MBP0025191.1 hypothetical protein [Roseofilum sp. SID2]MBP0039805.1 hypothetical protein [Roseofilum sp. SID1]MBP0044378.1 hypothetical protein [Roseofilum sp. SBFL]